MSPAALAFKLPAHAPDFGEWDDEQRWATQNDDANRTDDTSDDIDSSSANARTRGHRFPPLDTGANLDTLRSQVATIVAGNHSAGPAWPTGVAELDRALGGGVPRGRVTEVVGARGAGKTALVRQLVARVLADGGWVAWIDATRTLAPQELAGLGERLIVVRPRDHTRGAWCADLLLRNGVFALVVLDGAPVLSRVVGVRLSQLARERDAAFVVLREGTQASRLGGAVRLQVKAVMKTTASVPAKSSVASIATTAVSKPALHRFPQSIEALRARIHATTHAPPTHTQQAQFAHATTHAQRVTCAQHIPAPNDLQRNYSVLVEKGGAYKTVEVHCAIVLARRVCADSEIPDRRGVARRPRAATLLDTGSNSAPDHEHAVVAAAGQQLLRHFTSKGRGRTRAAESSYGRFTRRGEARRLLHQREQQSQNASTQRDRESSAAATRHVTQHFQPGDAPYPRKERQYQPG